MELAPFEPLKAIQASAVLLNSAPAHRMSRKRLLKLLYIADRESIHRWGRPITGDAPVAMRQGPVLRHTYNMIKEDHVSSPQWSNFFANDGWNVILKTDPGLGQLSDPEIALLREVSTTYKNQDANSLGELTHGFKEWIKNQPQTNTSVPISVEDILDALGMSDEKEELLAAAAARKSVDQLLAAYRK